MYFPFSGERSIGAPELEVPEQVRVQTVVGVEGEPSCVLVPGTELNLRHESLR